MSYRRVLDNLTQGEQRNADRAARFDQNMITHERNRDLQQLDAIKGFSKSLDTFVQDKYKRDDEQLQKDMELKVAEEHLEAKEQTGDPNISEEVNAEYVENRDTVLKNDKELAKTANSALEQGASFQEAKQIHNLSGAALYYYVRAKSKIAAEGYDDWINGEMQNNGDLKLEYNGQEFTPQTAETLEQKKIAMKALRREYMRQNDLGSVNPALLNDESVGFYDKAITSHNTLYKKYVKDDAIQSGFEDRQKAVEEFRDDKDFESLLGKIKITANEDGEGYNRAEALDETFEILTDLAKTGQLSLEDLKAIQNQEIEINGKKAKVSKWQTRWLKLEQDVKDYNLQQVKNAQNDLKIAKQEFKDKFTSRTKELREKGEVMDEEELAEHLSEYEKVTGLTDYPDWLKNYATQEDRDDDQDKRDLDELRRNRGYLVESDLDDVSNAVYKEYSKIVKDDSPLAAKNPYAERADDDIKALVTEATGLTAEKRNTPVWRTGYNNTIDFYNETRNQYIRDGLSPSDAHAKTMEIIEKSYDKENSTNNKFFEKKDVISDKDVTQIQEDKRIAANFIRSKDFNNKEDTLNFLENEVIPLSEKHLEKAEYYLRNGGEIPSFYTNLARDIKGVSGWDIMVAQVKANKKRQKLYPEATEGGYNISEDTKKELLKPSEEEVLDNPVLKEVENKLRYKSNFLSINQAKYDFLDINNFLEFDESFLNSSTDDSIPTFTNSILNIEPSLMMEGIQ